ncbi:MAG: Hsp20/alpha crystallin family protein [Fimbriimonadaceae bacterium]|nr:Hsp20/alpha crystallin family protein [Fimbriimonadaceae bacterium]
MDADKLFDTMAQLGALIHGSPRDSQSSQGTDTWSPRLDLLEAEAAYVVRVEIAGVPPSRLSLTYEGRLNRLTIRGEREEAPRADTRTVPHRLEIEYGGFVRHLDLPGDPVDLQGACSRLSQGMLTLVLPKIREEQVTVIISETISITTKP